MEIGFNNFAKAGSGAIRINGLTVIFGPNNTGKTYINYAIFSILSNFRSLISKELSFVDAPKLISKLNSKGSANLDLSAELTKKIEKLKTSDVHIIGPEIHQFFQVPEEFFSDTKFTVRLDELDMDSPQSFSGGIEAESADFSYEFEFRCNGQKRKLKITSFKSEKEFDSSLNIELLEDSVARILYDRHVADIIPTPFAVTNERTGISLFYKTFDHWNSKILKFTNQRMNSNQISMEELDSLRSLHALPIDKNIDSLRFYQKLINKGSIISRNRKNFKEIVDILSILLDDGKFESTNDSLFYIIKEKSGSISKIPLHATSSSVKSLFLLDLFIKSIAQKGSILILDEPELNLCVDNQVLMARLVARLVNAGVKVLITTHSDYFVREINNLITLSSAKRKRRLELMKKFGFKECDLLTMDQVSAYRTNGNENVEGIDVFKSGIDSTFWDESIHRENKKSEEIYYASELD